MRKSYAGMILLVLAKPALAQGELYARPIGEARVPNLLGATGLLLTPSAYVQRDRQISAFLGGNHDFVAGGVSAGLCDRLELGLTALDGSDRFTDGDAHLLADAKLSLLRETLILPALSVGVVDAFDALNKGAGWYLVTSKYLIGYLSEAVTGQKVALKLHVGYGGGIYDEEFFAGAELFFPRALSAMAEYTNGKFNFGGRFHTRGIAATLALFDFDHVGGSIRYSVTIR
jgi:hypothetical protein